MQISTRSHDYIIDTLELRNDLYLLNEIFTDANIIKVNNFLKIYPSSQKFKIIKKLRLKFKVSYFVRPT